MGFAVVTGASSGLGEVFARRLAERGHDLVVVARRRERLEALAGRVKEEQGRRVEVVEADLATPAGRDAVWARTEALGAPVEVLVNNAGFGLRGDFARLDRARQLEMIQLNVTAVTDLAHRYVVPMIERKRGVILNVASIASYQPVPYLDVYAATKAYVLLFSEALAEEVRDGGVRVLALCPGPVATEFQAVSGTSIEDVRGRYTAVSPERCVDEALAGLDEGRSIVVPGLPNRLLTASVGFFPRALITRLAGQAYRKRGEST
jgi:uncharacterized protein